MAEAYGASAELKKPAGDDAELLAEGRKAYDDDYALMSRDRDLAREDIEFADGDQWLADGERRRKELLPTLQINQFDQFLNQVVNEFRKQPFGIKVRPLDGYATVQTANKLQGLCRHVENNSSAKLVYTHALKQATKSGLGWFRVNYDFLSCESFEMEVAIQRILNRFSVVPGYAEKQDYSDMKRCFVVEDITKEACIALYGEDSVSSDFPATDQTYRRWFGQDTVTIGEYWKVKEIDDKLLQLSNGYKIFESIFTKEKQELYKGKIQVLQSRPTQRRQIEWSKMTGVKVLSKRIWPGYWIPIIPVIGNEAIFPDGEIIYSGLIRNAKDPQRMYNYWASIETQLLSAHSKRRIITAEGQLEGHEPEWQKPDSSILTYKPKSLNGQMVPEPHFEQFDGVPVGVVNAKVACREDMKSAMGLYNDSIGATSNARSGVAIARRQQEGDTAIFHYLDNTAVAIQHCGRIVIDLSRKVISKPTWRRILNEQGKEEQVLFNEETTDANGKKVLYDLSVGEFEVYIDTGPSFASKRQETLDLIVELAKYVPEVLKFSADVVFENADGIGMDRLASRARKFIDPKFLEGEENSDSPQEMISTLQTQNAQYQQQLQVLTQAVQHLTDELVKAQDTSNDKTNELNVKLQIAELQSKTQIELAAMKINQETDIGVLKEMESLDAGIQKLMDQLGNANPDTALDPNAQPKPKENEAEELGGQPTEELGGQPPEELGAQPPQAGPSPEQPASVEEPVQ
jgi:hypothetical protein